MTVMAGGEVREEDADYLRTQLLTYIGNKRSLLPLIERGVSAIQRRLGGRRMRMLDGFAGSGVVSRRFKLYADYLVSNDFEPYAAAMGRCYLANRSDLDLTTLRQTHAWLNDAAQRLPVRDGMIRRLYAPRDDTDIQPGERVFYTADNAARLDSYRTLIGRLPADQQTFFLAPLLVQASIHANTSGVFKGFYKNAQTGIGQFGGTGRDALSRILRPILLPFPVLSRFETEVRVTQSDTNALVRTAGPFDIAYFDPPYNQHPYGSNYFMLNLLLNYREPAALSRVSGIPGDWQRSPYNRRDAALDTLRDLLEHTAASHILISYNDEGFISRGAFEALLGRLGRFEVLQQQYNTFRGSRNLRARRIHLTEQLFLLEVR